MRDYSNLHGETYYSEDVRYIGNMQQNFRYWESGLAYDQLVDIICGRDNKLIFVWKKSPVMSELYDLWCKHELGNKK